MLAEPFGMAGDEQTFGRVMLLERVQGPEKLFRRKTPNVAVRRIVWPRGMLRHDSGVWYGRLYLRDKGSVRAWTESLFLFGKPSRFLLAGAGPPFRDASFSLYESARRQRGHLTGRRCQPEDSAYSA